LKISRDEFFAWLAHAQRQCHYCGVAEEQLGRLHAALGLARRSTRLEIDRRDNDRPYETGNLVLACYVCNAHKVDFFSESEFLEIAKHFITPKVQQLLR